MSVVGSPGTLQEALDAMKSDLINTAVQHEVMAENIMTDVHDPIFDLRTTQSVKTKTLNGKVTSHTTLT